MNVGQQLERKRRFFEREVPVRFCIVREKGIIRMMVKDIRFIWETAEQERQDAESFH